MGFWQTLVDSYNKNADALKSRYPISTTTISNNQNMIAVIAIDGDGQFIKAEKIEVAKNDKKTGKEVVPLQQICIPVSEESMKRSGKKTLEKPHPIFDQYKYLTTSFYLSILEKFAKSSFATLQVRAVYQYIVKSTIEADLADIAPKNDTNIVFRVEIPGNPQANVWENEALFSAWNNYYLKSKEDTPRLDYLTGQEQLPAISHPKKITSTSANAKLISNNDNTNFTFRGKFNDSSEAVSIGYETSQKAHQFLRYLINDRGYYCGEQVILSFTVGSTEKIIPPPIEDRSILESFPEMHSQQTESDRDIALRAETGFDYGDALRKSLAGLGCGNALEQHEKTVITALDAATTGRLSITFYRELDRNEYLERIADWHGGCKWKQKFRNNKTEKWVFYIGAPSVDKIIEAVYGKPRSGTDASYTKIKKSARERLLRCIFDGTFLPKDYVIAAARRASNPLGITKNGKFDRNGFEKTLATTCALARKYYHEQEKEEYKLRLEHNRTDRNYLYGRLLGAADKLEEYALYKKDKDRIVTAAIRHMQAFSQHPFRTWQTIHSCLNPYIKTVKGSIAFREIEAIKDQFVSVTDYENDTALNSTYLIGYYHERAYIDRLVAEAKAKKTSMTDQ